MNDYRFEIARCDGQRETHSRDLPDDAAALVWMGREILMPGDALHAFRDGEDRPFAYRMFAGDPEVFG